MFDKLIYMPLDIPNPPNIVAGLDEQLWPDAYRNCNHIALMDRDGNWLVDIPEFKAWAEEYLFAFAKPARMVIIVTEEGETNPPHIDCSPQKFHTWQHKFRYVFQGNVSDLHFLTKDGEVTPPNLDRCYIMDGSWPHEMRNTYPGRKYTLALGSPWEPTDSDLGYLLTLATSDGDETIWSDSMELPENYEDLYEDRYKEDKGRDCNPPLLQADSAADRWHHYRSRKLSGE